VAVKINQSAEFAIKVLEKIAEYQPVGVTELSDIMGNHKSSLQRALVTLAECKWIRMTNGKPTGRWELSERINSIAYMGRSHSDLRSRARAPLEHLRDETGETVVLAIPEDGHMVLIEVFESRQMLRTSAAVGMTFPVRDSASGLAVLASLDPHSQNGLLGRPLDVDLRKQLHKVRKLGYAVNDEALVTGSSNIGAAVFEAGRPIGAIVVAGPSERLTRATHSKIGAMLVKTAEMLSYGRMR
jgi:IclR family acetate operon transcriptional repressor